MFGCLDTDCMRALSPFAFPHICRYRLGLSRRLSKDGAPYEGPLVNRIKILLETLLKLVGVVPVPPEK